MRRKKQTFIDLLENYFETYLPVAKGLSDATIRSYKATFRLLFEFMNVKKGIRPDKVDFFDLNQDTISDFLDWLETERGCSISTRNQRLSALAAFSIYAMNRDYESATVFRNSVFKTPKKKAPKAGRNPFTRDEVKLLFSLPDAHTETGKRDKVLLCFMYASGMRAQEICDLTVGDIQFYPDRAGINVHGKGCKVRRIGIPADAAGMLKKYIVYRKIQTLPEKHVFSSQTHEKMTVSCIEEIYAKYVSIAKEQNPGLFRHNYTTHSMRHTTATHMLEAGVPLIVVKNFLGHVSLQTTQIYTEVTQDTMDKQLRSWNEKWFLKETDNANEKKNKNSIPSFLR